MLSPPKRFAVINGDGFKHTVAIQETAVGYGNYRLFRWNEFSVDQCYHTCRRAIGILARTLGRQEAVPIYFFRKAYAGSGCKFNDAKKPPAFASVSSYSAEGTESATMPAPTWK